MRMDIEKGKKKGGRSKALACDSGFVNGIAFGELPPNM